MRSACLHQELKGKNSVSKFYIHMATSGPRKRVRLEAIKKLMPLLNNEDRAADIGTGGGEVAYYFATQGKWKFIDNDPLHIRTAETILGGECITQEGEDFLTKNSGFKLLTFIDTLIYFPDIQQVLSLAHASLVPRGFILITGSERVHKDPITQLRKRIGIDGALGYFSNPDSIEMEKMLSAAGFSIVKREHFAGVATYLLQTVMDAIFLFFQRKKTGSNLLTSNFTGNEWIVRNGKWVLPLLRVCSFFTHCIDRLLWFLPSYNFAFLCQKN